MQTDQADFTYWMSFPLANLLGEISPYPEIINANLKYLISME